MNKEIKIKLLTIAEEKQIKGDPSHDFQHILRVTNLAEKIAKKSGGDLDIIIPAALFHDVVVYKKNSPESKNESKESATVAGEILEKIEGYPKDKIKNVKKCIEECSFSKGIIPDSLESKVLQDADRLEATGAISIMRTFASSGQMSRPFYDPKDPLCKNGPVKFRSAIDLFHNRLLIVGERMHTDIARKMAKNRTDFLVKFLDQFESELKESDII